MKYIISIALSMCLLACSHARCVPLVDAIPGQISVYPDTGSPYSASMITKYFVNSLNKKACYSIATDGSAPYILKVRVLSSDSYMSGLSYSQYGATVNYRNRVEVAYELFDPNGISIYSGTAWAETGRDPMNYVSRFVANDFYTHGMLYPEFYKVK